MRISDWSSDVCSSDLRGLQRDLLPDLPVEALHQLLADQHAGTGAGESLALGRGHLDLRVQVEVVRRHREAEDLVARVLVGAAEPVGVGDLADAVDLADARQQRHRQGLDERQPRLGRSEEHTSELQSLMRISYAVFCLKKKKKKQDV